MEASDIMIHKGEKDEKYQLYVEDYVMSYLKNYRTSDRRQIFFYGEKNPKEKKYCIYGAGREKQISYFSKYELLGEITCHYVMDMPVFSVKEASGIYELAGYYIFYQSNDSMQSYMIEQRKNAESERKEENRSKSHTKNRPQSIENIKAKNKFQSQSGIQKKPKASNVADSRMENNELSDEGLQTRARLREKKQEKSGNGLMAVQLSAIFVIIIAIVINSTNSYTKLKELGQAAIEVFFALENQEAAESGEDVTGAGESLNETILRLADLDEKFEEENQTAKSEGENTEDKPKAEALQDESGKETDKTDEIKETAAAEGISSSEQAFSRNITEYYRIEKGDTLYTISIKIYGDSSKVDEICELNKITNPDHIEYGQKILLP